MISKNIGTGLDIGSNSIKIVQLKKTGQTVSLEKHAHAKIPNSKSVSEPAEQNKIVVNILKTLLIKSQIKPQNLIICVPRHLAIIKNISLPTQDIAEIEKMVRFEAQKQIPLPVEQLELGFYILSAHGSGGSDIMLVAVQKEVIHKYLNIAFEAGLKPTAVSLSSLTLFDISCFSQTAGQDENTALIELGAQTTEINIVNSNVLSLTRSSSVSGNTLTNLIQASLQKDFDQAEELKIKYGLCLGEKDSAEIEKIFECGQRWLDRLVTEIKRTFDTWTASHKNVHIDKIILSGGSCQLKGLKETLAEKLGLKLDIMQPWSRLKTPYLPENNKAQLPLFATATGLALYSLEALPLRINLMPASLGLEKKSRRRRMVKILSATLAGVILLTAGGILLCRFNTKKTQLKTLNARLAESKSLTEKIAALEEKIQTIKNYSWEGATSLELLWALSKFSAPDVQLTSFKFKKNAWLELSGKAGSRATVNMMVNILQKTGYFDNVELKYTESLPDGVSFGISSKIKNQGYKNNESS